MARRRKNKRKWISWLIILVLLIAAGVVVYLVWDNYFNEKKDEIETTETEQIDQQEDEGGNSEVELVNENGEKKTPPKYEGEDPNKAEELSGAITYAGVQDGKLMIRVNIDQYLSSGKCELTLKRGGATIYNSVANIIGNASTSSCEGFDVPTKGLGGGKTEIVIKLNANSKSGTIRREVNI